MRTSRKNRKKITVFLLAGSCLLAAGMSGSLSAAAQEEIEIVEEETESAAEVQSDAVEAVQSDAVEAVQNNAAEAGQNDAVEAVQGDAAAAESESGSVAETAGEIRLGSTAGEIRLESVVEVTAGEVPISLENAAPVLADAQDWKPEDAAVVTIPADVTSIDPMDFYRNKSIRTILVEEGNQAFTSRDGILYDKTGTRLLVYPIARSEHVIPEGTTVIGSEAFCGQQIEKIAFPDTLTELEHDAFRGAAFPEGTVLHLPSSLRAIGDYALWLLKPVKCVFVPASVRTLGHWGVHADIAIFQGKDTQLDEYPFFRETGGMLIGGLPGSTAEALLEKKANDKYSFAVLGEDGRIALDPSWFYVSGFYVYSGKPIEPLYGIASEAPLQFYSNAKLLLSCSNNVNAGWATARVSVDDEVFFGTIERDYIIPPASVAGRRVAAIPEQPYTGQPIRPKVEVTGLTEGVDYTVYYRDNTEVGLAYAVIYGKGNYGSKKLVSFRIVPPAPAKPETGADTGSPTIGWTVTTESGAYAETGRDLWTPEKGTAVRTLPQGTMLSSLKAGKRKITVKWKKVSGVTGYQIQYSTSKKFKSGKKTRTVSGAGSSKCVLKGLKAKKKYYVRIRTYRKVNGKKEYSAWSAAEKVKTK